jgi:hypothetical protein
MGGECDDGSESGQLVRKITAVSVFGASLASTDARIGLWRAFDRSVLLGAAGNPLPAGIAGTHGSGDETVIRAWPLRPMTGRSDQNTHYHADQSHVALPQKLMLDTATRFTLSSWPGLSRPSTTCRTGPEVVVDARHKARHDVWAESESSE